LNVVILPRANEADLDDVPLEVRNEIEFVLVDSLDQALAVALEDENEALERRQSAADTIGVPAELDHAS
jgi:ATP-dependent Lon protease